MKLTRGPLFTVVLPLLLACGSVDAPTPTPTPTPVTSTLTAACQHLFAQRAAYDQRCNGVPSPQEHAMVASCVGLATAPGSLLKAADIEACAVELGAPSCGQMVTYPACMGYGADLLYPNHDKKGTVHPGDACAAQIQCESGYCGTTSADCAHCVIPRAPGDSCTGAFDLCLAPYQCLSGTCQEPGTKVGEKCNSYGGGDCQSSLFCKTPAPDQLDGVCAARGESGAPCGDDRQCAPDAFCKAGACAARLPDGASCAGPGGCLSECIGGVCRPGKFGVAEGGSCGPDSCGLGLRCTDLTCVAAQYLPKDSACPADPWAGQCTPGQYCELDCSPVCASTGVCLSAPGPGEPCTSYGMCAPDAICVGFMGGGPRGTCVKLGGEGEACACRAAGLCDGCSDMLTCVKGKCAPYGASICE